MTSPTGSGDQAAALDDRARPASSPFATAMRSRATWIFILDLVLIALFTAISRNHVFFSLPSFQSLSINMAESLLLALGMSMLLGAGIFDLSIGANLVLSAVIGAKVIASFQASRQREQLRGSVAGDQRWARRLSCDRVLFGLINGLIITVGGVNSLIATLATFGIGTGMAYLISGGSDIGAMPPVLQEQIGLRKIGGIVPLPAVIALIAFAVLWVAVRYLRYGMRVQAIGSSKTAADRAGVPVRNYLLSLTMLAGLLASMAGFIDVAKFGSTSLAGHGNDALAAVTAAVIGGTLLEGGFISIIGTLWGAALAVILQSGLVISGVSAFWQLIAVGVVLLVAVLLDRVAARRRDRAR